MTSDTRIPSYRSDRRSRARFSGLRLEEAVIAHRDALKEYTRERVPLQWAMTQNNLGTAPSREARGTRERHRAP